MPWAAQLLSEAGGMSLPHAILLLDAGLLGGAEARSRLEMAQADDVRPALERALLTSATTVTRAGSNPPHRHEVVADEA